jgi:hypothetical protein
MTTTTLTRFLSLVAGRPVIDRSGYAGMADIKLDFTPAYKVSSELEGPPSIFNALPELPSVDPGGNRACPELEIGGIILTAGPSPDCERRPRRPLRGRKR